MKESSPLIESDIISIKGARMHNLKGIDVDLPKNNLIVITGLSGSGKSSLAFDTLYAEGQRRYVESLSAYARQFLGRLNKPECDSISGLSPAIAVEQKVVSRNPRSTVGTVTEIYDFLKLLYARLGKTFSPISGKEVKKHLVEDVLDYIQLQDNQRKLLILAPINVLDKNPLRVIELLQSQGFARIRWEGKIYLISELLKEELGNSPKLELVVDRAVADSSTEENVNRLADSIQTAFYEGSGNCILQWVDTNEEQHFSNRFEEDGMSFEIPSQHLFSFNNPYGACPTCEGFGTIIGIDEDLVVPDGNKSVYEEAIMPWRGEKMQEWKDDFIIQASSLGFPVHRPYDELNAEQKDLLWNGKGKIHGIRKFFQYVEQKSYKIQYRVMLARYRGKTQCTDCKGTRLRKESNYVKLNERSLSELVDLSISDLLVFIRSLNFKTEEQKIAKRLLTEIDNRLTYLVDVGLPYLNLNRTASTLSGGESQRIQLANSLGSSLVGSMYILDEPSIGLHPKDTQRLIGVLRTLRDLGNTVIVVEHDEDIMKAADYIVDIGPEAGFGGGQLIYQGSVEGILSAKNSHTADYLNGNYNIEDQSKGRIPHSFIRLEGAKEHNLKNVSVEFPLGVLTAVTGVSGSGKSTLIRKILYPALKRRLEAQGERPGKFKSLSGSIEKINRIEMIDQNPIGRSSRSNPVTYVKAYDDIRNLFADQALAAARGLKAKHFSFNVAGGRCDSCEGEGYVNIEMQFMADVHIVCEQCKGKKFKEEILDVKFDGKNIFDILELTVDEAIDFFTTHSKTSIVNTLKSLQEVGLGYVKLGQSSSTLSGGEAQRIKLATFLLKGKDSGNQTLFIFDEPTTGLHFHDVSKLLKSFNALIERGHSILVIEHHPDVIHAADWIVDIGPAGGDLGGNILFSGLQSDFKLQRIENSSTWQCLYAND